MNPGGLLLALLLACSGRSWRAPVAPGEHADVVGLRLEEGAEGFTFWVTVQSPDEGCGRFAAFWEVVDERGESLLLRRILAHAHVDEQPFTRAAGPLRLQPDARVVVRAWMRPGGYGGQALRGSLREGFASWTPPPGFGEALAAEGPQPEFCAF